MQTSQLTVGLWNILADGLSANEFMTNGKNNIEWDTRRVKILNILEKMLSTCHFVVTIENDHFYYFLNELNKRCNNNIAGIYYLETKTIYNKPTTEKKDFSVARKVRTINSTTFLDDCGPYAEDFASLYGLTPDQPYTSDDGIAIYYDKKYLELVDTMNNHKINQNDNVFICAGNNQYMCCRLDFLGTPITVIVAHLSSGEEIRKEMERVNKLAEILNNADSLPNPIILMDGNNSNLYEDVYKEIAPDVETMFDVIAEWCEYYDVVPSQLNECFKMRHAQGNQPSKFCRLMFDTIDKIIIQKKQYANGFSLSDNFGFIKYPSFMGYDIMNWRVYKRDIIQKYATEHNWKEDMNDNTTEGLAALLGYTPLYNLDMSPDLQVKEIFKQLYPGQFSPSDHAPIAVRITL